MHATNAKSNPNQSVLKYIIKILPRMTAVARCLCCSYFILLFHCSAFRLIHQKHSSVSHTLSLFMCIIVHDIGRTHCTYIQYFNWEDDLYMLDFDCMNIVFYFLYLHLKQYCLDDRCTNDTEHIMSKMKNCQLYYEQHSRV